MSELLYRQGVNAFVVDENNNFLLVHKQNYGDGQWDVPGGGLENGEDLETGILRELEEELGTNSFRILKKSNIINKFEWPEESQQIGLKKYGIRYRGQEKHQFLVQFTGNKNDIKLQEAEIKTIKWVALDELEQHMIFENQWNIAKATLQDLGFSI